MLSIWKKPEIRTVEQVKERQVKDQRLTRNELLQELAKERANCDVLRAQNMMLKKHLKGLVKLFGAIATSGDVKPTTVAHIWKELRQAKKLAE